MPAVLQRTPYDNITGAGLQFWPWIAAYFAARGYAFVSQDVRGRGDSDGEWEPFVDEGLDGYDTIEWIAGQPWCDGTVGFMGASYGGFVQWAAAAKWRVAQNTVMHTEEQSSHSLAPIVGQSMMPRRQAWP